MATCPVCHQDLPAQRGPRARRYCSRACQAKAYRARQQQHSGHRTAAADEPELLREYDSTPSLQLADQLALAARRLAGALTAGQPADDFDMGVVARIPVVLAARARQAAPAAQAVHGRPDSTPAPSVTVVNLDEQPVSTSTTADAPSPAQPSRDEPKKAKPARAPARPPKLSEKAAMAVVDAAQLKQDKGSGRWVLRSSDTVLGYVEPSYGGTSRSGHNGWVGMLSDSLSPGHRCPTREAAAVDLAGSWVRVVTATPRRSLTGD
ncbi:hypothetical protein [Streptomyces sp. NBC_01669]|uniref:hypothetical protein n=1 Tax=Streptomyces sp. NBC_01669 TaxID=2975909 RepID=UPI00224FCD52|nr:hypothetical protein [Streptomyces sp. NBC_01669]MCX4538341.1 hypothetical protein [Streptomyces sp. NBC_01669]